MRGDVVRLKAVSFNIRNGKADDGPNAWPFRRELVAQSIAELAGDVVGLQEAYAYQLDELLPELPQYACSGVGRADGLRGGEFCPVLYLRGVWRAVDEGTFWLSETPERPGSLGWGARIPRICSWVRLVGEEGSPVTVLNVHLDHETTEARRHGVELLAGVLGPGPFVLMGDFNAGEEEPEVQYLKGELLRASEPGGKPVRPSPPLQDTFRTANPYDTEVATYHAFDPDNVVGDKIDYVFVRQCDRVISADIWRQTYDGRPPSDHFPVYAELELGAE